ncbi:MAG TPA: hypothetical protein VJI46_02050 [Candidatus Nanoarchaeia archaeon]|nr:hypothetical protein [Candidatus Nanoarchaeia archaeon]
MNQKLRKIFTNWRVIVMLLFIIFGIISLNPRPWREGVAIRSVEGDSAAYEAGMTSSLGTTRPIDREYIISVNNKPISSVDEFYSALGILEVNDSVLIETNLKVYRPVVKEKYETITLNETEIVEVTKEVFVNKSINGTNKLVPENITVKKEVPKTKKIPLGAEDLGLKLYELPHTNLKMGLDLEGGTRVLINPGGNLSSEQFSLLLEILEQRLDIYKLSDLVIRGVSDLEQNRYILIEIAGASESEVRKLIGSQGKFEAKIANETVFRGDQIEYICRDPSCSGLDPSTGCGQSGDAWSCGYRFEITVNQEAAESHRRITEHLDVVDRGDGQVLSEQIDFYLDDAMVRSLFISSELKNSSQRTTSITGFGEGPTEQVAAYNSLQDMKQLQTILSTGVLPVKLEITSINTISPVLGIEFLKNAVLVGVLSILTVGIMVYLRYRKLAVSIPIMITMLSELVILLGSASLINWNMSLSAIAGIIIAIGAGVDHQIVITDETLSGKTAALLTWKEKIKNAFAIIMGSYFTNVVALIPLVWAGAGLVQGFAITTILGFSIGVFITRPCFAAIIEILLKE